ncbi:MAG: Do family serine endopeptidase [Polyangiaceae bacterium]|nr:Do family serine endopeptidase [Polyangiaceae bacterium]
MTHASRLRASTTSLVLVLGLSAHGCARANAAPPSAHAAGDAPPAASQAEPFARAAPPFPTPPLLQGSPDIAALAERVKPTVVNITTSQRVNTPPMVDPFEFFFGPGRRLPGIPELPGPGFEQGPRNRSVQSLGSGFVLASEGYVVTNNHVIENADDVTVRFADDKSYDAKVVGRDARLDIALLQLEGASALPSVVLGDSDVLRVGEQVMAVGNPFGLGHTVTTGIVSAKDRTIGAGPYDDFIQTDASINPGNSGGPLFNLRGEVVGINTAIHAQGQGIGFAIPINLVRDAFVQLKEAGRVERGKLGISFQPVSEDIAKALGRDRRHGALVSDVEPGGPADKAGIKPGDLILKVDGDDVTQGTQLPRLIARNSPGTHVQLTLLRGGQRLVKRVTLEALESDTKGIERANKPRRGEQPGKFGLSLEPAKDGGVMVTRVSDEAAGKLQRGDVILSVDGTNVSSPEQVVRAMTAASAKNRPALLRVRRQGRILFVAFDAPR